jgi:hypothetical protein
MKEGDKLEIGWLQIALRASFILETRALVVWHVARTSNCMTGVARMCLCKFGNGLPIRSRSLFMFARHVASQPSKFLRRTLSTGPLLPLLQSRQLISQVTRCLATVFDAITILVTTFSFEDLARCMNSWNMAKNRQYMLESILLAPLFTLVTCFP